MKPPKSTTAPAAASLRRRDVVVASLATALIPDSAQAQGILSTTGIAAGDVRIRAADGPLPGFFARPARGGPHPIVLVNEDVFGLDDHLKDVCRRLARLGYAAVLVEIYARVASQERMADTGEVLRNFIPRTPDAEVMSDLNTAIAYAAAHGGDPNRVGVIGFGRGGRTTWLHNATTPSVRASVAWYGPVGGVRTPLQPYTVADLAPNINAPLLALHAGQDTEIAIPDVQDVVTTAKSAGRAVQLFVYPDAPHGFFNETRDSYRPDAAADSWGRALDWLRHFGV